MFGDALVVMESVNYIELMKLWTKKYHQILKHQFVPSNPFPTNKFIFHQDNEPKQTSKLLQAYIQRKGWEIFEWNEGKIMPK